MKRAEKTLSVLFILLAFFITLFPSDARAVGEEQAYSYNYDEFGYGMPAPSPYTVRYQIDAAALGVGSMKNPLGIFVRDEHAYICDTGNSRILEVFLGAEGPKLERVIESSGEGDEWALSEPYDVFVSEDGELYIANYKNEEILRLDNDLKLICRITAPDSDLYDSSVPFHPMKLVVTAGGHLYVQAKGVTKGLVEFSDEGEFVGYMGASKVTFNWEDYIWKRILTREQRSQLASFIPTEYNNVAVDSDGFLYVTLSNFEVSKLRSGNQGVVRRLNLKGTDILVQNDPNWKVIGDQNWTWQVGPSLFVDITAMDNGSYYVLDKTKNRIFAYDQQGYSLYVFGGFGYKAGYFQTPVAIEHNGKDLLILDSTSCIVTVMKLTSYGSAISDAIDQYQVGKYEEAYSSWNEVLRLNGNYKLAYTGIGRILLRKGEYREALKYLKYAKDGYYYSKAWKLYRKEWVGKNLIWIVTLMCVVVVVSLVLKTVNRMRGEVAAFEEKHSRSASERS